MRIFYSSVIFFVLSLLVASAVLDTGLGSENHYLSNAASNEPCNISTSAQYKIEGSILASVNIAQAESTAEPQVSVVSAAYTSSFGSMVGVFNESTSCTPILQAIKLEYSLSNGSGIQKEVVITLDPALTTVLNVTVNDPQYFGTTYNSANWAGYNYYDSNFMYYAQANWNEPSVKQAWSGQCDLANCDYAFWIGLTDVDSGADGIIQTGTDSGVYCALGLCSHYYYAWMEAYPVPPVTCFNISPGDQIFGLAYYYSGTYTYQIFLYDSNNLLSCSSLFVYPWSAHYAQFMGERPMKYLSLAHLPEFYPTLTVTNGYYDSYHNGYVSLNSGWAEDINMNNGQYCLDITPTSVSGGSFTEPWTTSCGT